MDKKPALRIVTSDNPWSDPRSYRPDLLEALARNEQRLWKSKQPTFSDRINDALGMKFSHVLVCAGVVLVIVIWLCVGRS